MMKIFFLFLFTFLSSLIQSSRLNSSLVELFSMKSLRNFSHFFIGERDFIVHLIFMWSQNICGQRNAVCNKKEEKNFLNLFFHWKTFLDIQWIKNAWMQFSDSTVERKSFSASLFPLMKNEISSKSRTWLIWDDVFPFKLIPAAHKQRTDVSEIKILDVYIYVLNHVGWTHFLLFAQIFFVFFCLSHSLHSATFRVSMD